MSQLEIAVEVFCTSHQHKKVTPEVLTFVKDLFTLVLKGSLTHPIIAQRVYDTSDPARCHEFHKIVVRTQLNTGRC